MNTTAEPRPTIWRNLYGALFFAGACLLVIAAFFLLLIIPLMVASDAIALARRGEFDLFRLRGLGLLAASGLAWTAAIAVAVLMARSDRMNRDFDKSLRISLKGGASPLDKDAATARDVAEFLLARTAPACGGFQFSEVIDEDYGAGFWASRDKDTFWIAVSAASDDVDKPGGRFVVSVAHDAGLSLLRRLWHRPDRERYTLVFRAVGAAAKSLRASK